MKQSLISQDLLSVTKINITNINTINLKILKIYLSTYISKIRASIKLDFVLSSYKPFAAVDYPEKYVVLY